MTASLAGTFDEFNEKRRTEIRLSDGFPEAESRVRGTPAKESSQPEVPSKNNQSRWILNPVMDYLFACGGLVWLLFGFHYFVLAGSTQGPLSVALLTFSALGALLLGEGHTAATLVHTYRRADLRNRLSFYTKLLPLFFGILAACGTVIPGVAPILVKIYLLIVPHHFMAQSYGIARVYCLKQGYVLGDDERRALLLVTWCTTIFAVIRQLTVIEPKEKPFLGQAVPTWQILPEPLFVVAQVLLISCIFAFVAIITLRGVKEKRLFPVPALLTMATGIAGFTMIQSATGIYWLYVSAFFHATQYFLTVLVSHWNEQQVVSCGDRIRSLTRNSSTTRMLGIILLVSVFIYIGIPRILESFGLNYMLAMAAIFSTMNMHHTAIDGVLWKLRRAEVRKAVSA